MGGFHLGGAGKEALIEKTIAGLKELDPVYVIPTHCTGRQAVMTIEQAMPGKVLINMAGTKMTFAA
jgi:7,8-dihydropterin-6-yl-methyl-4-(beta-D-ribofuranosyl)aminobenzene 5'-phosphate synthase